MALKKIRFVTDSTCDLPAEIVQKYNISVIPTFVNMGDRSLADNGVELVREDFYRNLLSMNPLPTTSAMPPGLADEIIRKAFADADHLFLISVASKLSGVYNSMRLSANKLPPERVTLIDSKSVTMGLGFQVLAGAEVADATGDVDQVKAAVERTRDRAHVYAALETMEFLRRSGRIGWGAASVGALLQIKPMLEVLDGEVKPLARVRTFSRAVDELIRLVHEQAPLERLAVLYISDHAEAEKLRDRLADVAPVNTLIASVTPTIGTHVGTGGLGVATVSQS
ncbi:MAG TPA: DegV family protein [Phototrophicaceae bacterium]|nr:DegV family protein [Phototrophicaceae bacterium]